MGGHGKRSFQAPVQLIREWPNTNEDPEYDDEDVNKNIQAKISSPHYATFWQKWVGRNSLLVSYDLLVTREKKQKQKKQITTI